MNKVIVKTKPNFWMHTDQPVILPFSIHSALYEDNEAEIKIETLIDELKNYVKGHITVLFCEKAHVETLSLKFGNKLQDAIDKCCEDATKLKNRFSQALKRCEVSDWVNFVEGDINYGFFKNKIVNLYKTNDRFRSKVNVSAKKSYNVKREKEFADKESYIHKAELDILEQCVYLLVTSKKGYKYEFYPSRRCESAAFVNKHLLEDDRRLIRVIVGFLSI